MALGAVGCGGDNPGAAKPLSATTTSAAPTPSVQAALGLVDDQESADAGKAIEVKVLGNDSVTLKDGRTGNVETALTAGQFTVSVATAPAHGSATVDGNTITYTSTPGYGGDDEFSYRVDVAGQSLTGTAVVRITVAKPTPTPTPKPPKPAVSYANCDAVRAMRRRSHSRGGAGLRAASRPGRGRGRLRVLERRQRGKRRFHRREHRGQHRRWRREYVLRQLRRRTRRRRRAHPCRGARVRAAPRPRR